MSLETMKKHKTKMRRVINALYADLDDELIHEFIIPFADQYKLDFMSGMGTFFFKNKTGTHIRTCDKYQKFTTIFWKNYIFVERMIWEINGMTKFLGNGFDYESH